MSAKKTFTPLFPMIKVELIGAEGNAGALLTRCKQAMEDDDMSLKLQTEFVREATRGDYDRLLRTAMAWFDVE